MADPTAGPARERIDRDEAARLARAGTLILDDRRRRPRWFDGRFLAARDLTREQSYVLQRQADLLRAAGSGVVHGLEVGRGDGAGTLTISPGHGVTPTGEPVVLTEPVEVRLADLGLAQRLDASFGLARIPREPARARTGLFVLALRPVEFTANPIASYPTTVDGARSVEDGDIVEGVAVTLVPYPDPGGETERERRRARVALDVFARGGGPGLAAGLLPLAMVALQRNVVEWVDAFLVRRQAGGGPDDLLGTGGGVRALRAAQVRQHAQHLEEVLAERAAGRRGTRFAATEHFLALPPVGQLPAGALDGAEFSQVWFPPEVDVALSIVPEDELPALVDDALGLPPIDLAAPAGELESAGVLVLVPVERAALRRLTATLEGLTRPVRPAAPGLVAKRSPLETLRGLRPPRLPGRLPAPPAPAPPPVESPIDAAWREVLAGRELLWYVRRRLLHRASDVVGAAVRVAGDEVEVENRLTEGARNAGLLTRVRDLRTGATAGGGAEVVGLLAAPNVVDSPTVLRAAVTELESAERVDRAAALRVAERFSDPALGEGIARLERARPELTREERTALAESRLVPEIDRLARATPEAELPALAAELAEAARRNEVAAVVARRTATTRPR